MHYSIFDDNTYMVYSDDLGYVKIGLSWTNAFHIVNKIKALGYNAEIDDDPIFGGKWQFFL